MIFGEILKEIPCSLDIRSLFQRRSGMALEDYIDHVFGLLMYYITLDVDKLMENPGLACINVNTVFPEHQRISSQSFGKWKSFRDFFREYLLQRGIAHVRDDETFTRFRAIMNRISVRFFKKPFEPAAE